MIRYTSAKQLEIENFRHPFVMTLNKSNRWVRLAKLIPWDELAAIYSRSLQADKGRLSIDVRLAIGAMILKHKLRLDDRGVVSMIEENMYMQYFCGFSSFQTQRPFDPSLFVDIRKRLGTDKFDEMNEQIIKRAVQVEQSSKKQQRQSKTKGEKEDNPPPSEKKAKSVEQETRKDISCAKGTEKKGKKVKHKGKLKIDATVADQMIKYPTDLGLLNDSRQESERLIDELYAKTDLDKKPRTYRRLARKAYLSIAKKRKKTVKEIRKGIGKQLGYLSRNIKTIDKLLDLFEGKAFPLNKRDQKIFWVIQHIYDQQKYMYDEKTHSCQNRITNIYQPYVRPIPRGKEKADVEFGSKLGVSEVDGFSRINHLSWEAYNESVDLQQQVETYKSTHGYYPESVLADQIYFTRENRMWLKEKNIRMIGKPLGRPSKEVLSVYQKRKLRKERNQRNHIEGKFGQGKNAYGLSNIRARRQDTSESWISCIFFVMNLVKLMKLATEKGWDFLLSFVKWLIFIINGRWWYRFT